MLSSGLASQPQDADMSQQTCPSKAATSSAGLSHSSIVLSMPKLQQISPAATLQPLYWIWSGWKESAATGYKGETHQINLFKIFSFLGGDLSRARVWNPSTTSQPGVTVQLKWKQKDLPQPQICTGSSTALKVLFHKYQEYLKNPAVFNIITPRHSYFYAVPVSRCCLGLVFI